MYRPIFGVAIVFLLSALGLLAHVKADTGRPRSVSRKNIRRVANSDQHKELNQCSCSSCTPAILSTVVDGYSCGDRIEHLAQTKPQLYPNVVDACYQVSNVEYPETCGACDPTKCNKEDASQSESDGTKYCGCSACDEDAMNLSCKEGGLKCLQLIEYLMANASLPELDACTYVATWFPDTCGLKCNPSTCAHSIAEGNFAEPSSPSFDDNVGLYCFPDRDRRKEFSWLNKYVVQVKESESSCGPGGNIFGSETVGINGNDLKLQFKRVNGVWTGSEVRVLLPHPEMPYTYGTYSFSVKSVSHKNSGGQEISKSLPPSLVLGLFTWDPTDDYSIRQNFNKEVDVEISRWGDPANMDLQFLLQPDGEPQMERFFSGSGNTLEQGGHFYNFTWVPGEITWSSDAGGGRFHSYATRDAVLENRPDYVQCLPANVEIRLNLWNMQYPDEAPSGMNDGDVVDVVVDDFIYMSSSLSGIEDGGICTKSCQCQQTSYCDSHNVCVPK